MLHGVLHLMGHDHETDSGADGARRETLARQTRAAQRPDRTGAVMILVVLALLAITPAAGPDDLRTGALPGKPASAHARPAFAEILQGDAGRQDRHEDGGWRRRFLAGQAHAAFRAGHSLLRLVCGRRALARRGLLAGRDRRGAHHDHGVLRAASIALPAHQRPLAAAAGPAAPPLRLDRAAVRRAARVLPIADRSDGRYRRCHRRADFGGKHRSADFGRHRRRIDRGGRPQADSIRGRVRRQGGARSHDAAAQYRRHLRRRHAGAIAPAGDHGAVLAHSGVRADHRPGDRFRTRARHVRAGGRRARAPHRPRTGAHHHDWCRRPSRSAT